MRKKTLVILSSVGFLALGIVSILHAARQPVHGQSGPEHRDPFATLNNKAVAAKGGDETAIGEVADEIFKSFGVGSLESSALAPLRDRLVRSEVAYRRTGKGSVRGNKVVQAINQFADRLGAPSYARTGLLQVRYLRNSLQVLLPNFIGQELSKASGKSPINPEMSPLEATGLTLLMLYQKVYNEEYQLTPDEWSNLRYQQDLAKWHARKNGSRPPEEKTSKMVASIERPKTAEMKHVLAHAVENSGPGGLAALANSLLDTIGISR